MSNRRIFAAAAVLLALSPAAAGAEPVIIKKGPVRGPLDIEGTGLCAATAVSTAPASDFGNLSPATYSGAMTAFMDGHKADRVESVIRTVFDLSNNNENGLKQSRGDFIDAMLPECKIGGCDFAYTDPATAFGMRARGFFNVTADLAGKPIHFGFFVDDAVSLTFWNKNDEAYPVIVHPPSAFESTHRLTETVTFEEPGLYPLEILYVEGADHAALEMSYFVGDFTDVSGSVSQTSSLKDAGFTLFQPTAFFQTLSGEPSFPSLNQCQQCDRQFVNQAGNNGCVPGYYCNESALCSPCNTAIFCGPMCAPCGGDTPFCVEVNGNKECASCRDDFDCEAGFTCDPVAHTCDACEDCAGASSSSASASSGAGGGGGSMAGDDGMDGGCDCGVSGGAPAGGLAVVVAGAALAHLRRRRRSG